MWYNLPDWVKQIEKQSFRGDEFSNAKITEINSLLTKLRGNKSSKIKVSVIIPAYNEQDSIIKCISTLANSKYSDGLEIIIVDNNSVDKTREIISKFDVVGLHQTIQGCGPTRQLGLEHAQGDIILLADADCVYSPYWVSDMVKALEVKGVSCVYGDCLFIPSQLYSPFKLAVHRLFKRIWAAYRSIKRPFLNAYGMSMAFYRDQGLEIGFIMNNKRGEDGRLCFDLMKKGKIRFMSKRRSRVYTPARALEREGMSFISLIKQRVFSGVGKIKEYSSELPPHDTKVSP